MADPELTPEAQALLAEARSLRVPEGARARVLEGAARAIAADRHAAKRKLVLSGSALAAAAAIILVWFVPRAPSPAARVLLAVDAGTPAGVLQAGNAVPDEAIEVGARGQLRIALERAQVSVHGPARIELAHGALVVHAGQAEIDGLLSVRGASCRAMVRGRCAVTRAAKQLQITLFAGSVQTEAPDVACSIVDLTDANSARAARAQNGGAAAEPDMAAPAAAAPGEPNLDAPARAPAAIERSAPPKRPAPRSELALQVDAYREALALRARDDARAVVLFREMNRRWPRSPLRHEIDLNVVDALVRLGRASEAAAEARRFLTRHPHSSKADAVRKSLGAGADEIEP